VLWVDAADSEPCCGTAGSTQWHLTANGKLFHSGFPNTTVNALELAMDTVQYLQVLGVVSLSSLLWKVYAVEDLC
jgi:acetylornithine deacetylase